MRVEEEKMKIVGLQSSSCFLRAECHLRRSGIYYLIRVSRLLFFTALLIIYLFQNLDKMYPDFLHFTFSSFFHYSVFTFP